METLSKITSPNVLASGNVNVPKTNLVTQPVVMFSNKPESAQKSKISNFFSVNSKDKSDISLLRVPAFQCPSLLASSVKVCQTTPKFDRPGMSNDVSTPVNLDASLGIHIEDWDDLDEFETPTKAKNTSLNEDINKTDCRPVTAERKTESIGGHCHLKPDEIQAMPDQTEVQQPAESELEDSPINTPRRCQQPYLKSVVSDSEEDNDDVPMSGNTLFPAVSSLHLCITNGNKWRSRVFSFVPT